MLRRSKKNFFINSRWTILHFSIFQYNGESKFRQAVQTSSIISRDIILRSSYFPFSPFFSAYTCECPDSDDPVNLMKTCSQVASRRLASTSFAARLFLVSHTFSPSTRLSRFIPTLFSWRCDAFPFHLAPFNMTRISWHKVHQVISHERANAWRKNKDDDNARCTWFLIHHEFLLVLHLRLHFYYTSVYSRVLKHFPVLFLFLLKIKKHDTHECNWRDSKYTGYLIL